MLASNEFASTLSTMRMHSGHVLLGSAGVRKMSQQPSMCILKLWAFLQCSPFLPCLAVRN